MRHPLLCLVLLLGPSVAADGAVRRVTVGMAVSVTVRVAVRVTVDLCLCNKFQIQISRLSHFLQYLAEVGNSATFQHQSRFLDTFQ